MNGVEPASRVVCTSESRTLFASTLGPLGCARSSVEVHTYYEVFRLST
jgi:hypothetical protein